MNLSGMSCSWPMTVMFVGDLTNSVDKKIRWIGEMIAPTRCRANAHARNGVP